MMTSDIDVIIYSYKGKLLKDVIGSVFANSSGTRNIHLTLIDQNPIVRENLFTEFPNFTYRYIFWDSQKSPLIYKKYAISKSRAKYILILGDNILLNKNWDEELTGFINNKNIIISGNKKISISQESLFYLNDDYEGGEIEFRHSGIKFKPKAGSVLFFPSNFLYVHEVYPVTKGPRYALPNWYHNIPTENKRNSTGDE